MDPIAFEPAIFRCYVEYYLGKHDRRRHGLSLCVAVPNTWSTGRGAAHPPPVWDERVWHRLLRELRTSARCDPTCCVPPGVPSAAGSVIASEMEEVILPTPLL